MARLANTRNTRAAGYMVTDTLWDTLGYSGMITYAYPFPRVAAYTRDRLCQHISA